MIEDHPAQTLFTWMLLLIFLVWAACNLIGCAGFYPPRNTKFKPDPVVAVYEQRCADAHARGNARLVEGFTRLETLEECVLAAILEPRSIDRLLALAPSATVTAAPVVQPDLALRVTNCYARTIGVAMAPVDLCAEVRVKPHQDNRMLSVTWNSDAMSGHSSEDLEGAIERITHRVKMSGLFGGEVSVEARLFDGLGEVRAVASARVNVIDRMVGLH